MSAARVILITILSIFLGMHVQAQFWTEDFSTVTTGCGSILNADNAVLASGVQLDVDTATGNVGFQNAWFVGPRLAFTAVGNCAEGCVGLPALTNSTLHISTRYGAPDPFATYDSDSATNLLVYTDDISLVGVSDVLLEFDYLLSGDGAGDNAVLGFTIGNGAFFELDTLDKTDALACGLQTQWVRYSTFLPPAVGNVNLPNFRIGFRWFNNNDSVETPVSFGVDNLSLDQSAPFADFSISRDTICVNDCVNFTDLSIGNPTAWLWDFGPNASQATSTAQNPSNICFTTVGQHVVTMTATNSVGTSAQVLKAIEVVNCDPPTPQYRIVYGPGDTSAVNAASKRLCETNCISFQNASLDGTLGQGDWTWQFQGGTPSVVNGENPQNICYSANGLYDITVTVVDTASGLDSTIIFADVIEIDTCSPPTADFTIDTNLICNNDGIFFQGLVTGDPDSVTWIFEGGNPGVLTLEATDSALAPNIFYNVPGTWAVTMIVWNLAGADTVFYNNIIEVVNCPKPIPRWTVNRRVICPGIAVVYEDLSLYATSWFWEFPGGVPSTSTDQNPQNIRYDTAGFYPVRLTVTNVNGDSTRVIEEYITVDSCLGPEARFEVESDSICRGSCVQFFNTSLRADSIFWVFNKVIPGLDDTIVNNFGVDTFNIPITYSPEQIQARLDSADSIAALLMFVTDTIFDLQDPILCFDDSLVIGLRLFTFNQYDVDVANFIDFPVLNIGGEYPTTSAGPDKIVKIDNINSRFFLEDTVQLEGEGTGEFFSWFPEDGLSCYDCATPVIYPTETRKYYLTNSDVYGCEVYDSVTVFVEQAFFAGIPNIFSPNGDNNNDVLWVRGNGISETGFVMRVWDRYGKMVFESYNQNDGWDGTFKGNEAPQGGYMYEVRMQFLDGTVEQLTGSVTLVRF